MPGWIVVCLGVSCLIGFICYYEEKRQVEQRYMKLKTACLIACLILGMTGATYQAGRYAARQYEAKAGVTRAEYRMNRWGYRAALGGFALIGGGTGAVAALAFDDYYAGL